MSTQLDRSAQAYWDITAETYDQVFPDTVIGRAQREAVWQELGRVFHCGQRILELNCGTGIDALHLAEGGVRVLACDISPRMIELARRRLSSTKCEELIDFRVLPTEHIGVLGDERPFDGAFSNFSGLNCVEDLSDVSRNLARLLKPGARVLICMLGRFVPWEILWHLAQGNPAKAVQRFRRGSVGRRSNDATVKVRYYSVSTIAHIFAPDFRLRERKGVGITMPSSHFESWARRFPRAFKILAGADRRIGRFPVLRGMAESALLQFVRVGT